MELKNGAFAQRGMMGIAFKGVNMLVELCCRMDIGVLFMKSKLHFYGK